LRLLARHAPVGGGKARRPGGTRPSRPGRRRRARAGALRGGRRAPAPRPRPGPPPGHDLLPPAPPGRPRRRTCRDGPGHPARAAPRAGMFGAPGRGGGLVLCHFGPPPPPRLDAIYGRYLMAALPAVARRLSPAGDAYEYLAESIRDWPGREELAQLIGDAGW